jgi:hypothetical protein
VTCPYLDLQLSQRSHELAPLAHMPANVTKAASETAPTVIEVVERKKKAGSTLPKAQPRLLSEIEPITSLEDLLDEGGIESEEAWSSVSFSS